MSDPVFLSNDVPFSLSCYECDSDSPPSYEAAVQAGWTEIQYTPDGLAENYLGLCPECAAKERDPGCSGNAK